MTRVTVLIPTTGARANLLAVAEGSSPDPDLLINTTPSPAPTDLAFACDD